VKLLFFDDYKMGVLTDGKVVDVASAVPHSDILPPQYQMESVITDFATYRPKFEELASMGNGVALSSVRLRSPLPRPHNVMCAFSNYLDREGATPGNIDFFYKGSTSVIGYGETVELPDIPEASVFQPEPELGYVIGKAAKHVSEADALNFVFGYTNFIDTSARGIQGRRTTFLHKGQDSWAPLGPVISTTDELPDPQKLQVKLWLNEELKQDYSTSLMAHSVAEQIAWLTQWITLMPGDVISCGTHHKGLSPINDGDHVEMEVEGCERLAFNVKSHGPRKMENWRPPGVKD
jgi:2-keto-4-pentenoate hydratase/2-oxohepta-3-ene-1,7-dioic acid hydratase in catechol pathway